MAFRRKAIPSNVRPGIGAGRTATDTADYFCLPSLSNDET
ncbi:hypothetical protein AB7M47_008803 [Bradyrhizobium elkanii]